MTPRIASLAQTVGQVVVVLAAIALFWDLVDAFTVDGVSTSARARFVLTGLRRAGNVAVIGLLSVGLGFMLARSTR